MGSGSIRTANGHLVIGLDISTRCPILGPENQAQNLRLLGTHRKTYTKFVRPFLLQMVLSISAPSNL
jgi:hypothetical protein